MSVITSTLDEILKLHGLPAYALFGGLAFGEAALFVGFVLPGDTSASDRYYRTDVTEPFVLDGGHLAVPTGPGKYTTVPVCEMPIWTVPVFALADLLTPSSTGTAPPETSCFATS